ncbi:MAG: alpha/beta fold hydrolase [Akkermansiaceae bacterium]
MIHCLHGAVGSYRDWEVFGKDLDESINPVDLWRLFDEGNPSLTEAGQIISNAADSDDVLLGYSMGGRLALHAILADPKKWKAAIIVCAHPGLIEDQKERLVKDRDWAELSKRDWATFLKQWNQQGILASLPDGLHQAEIRDQKPVSQSFLHWSLGTQKNLRSKLSRITCPILWITGAKDTKFTILAEEVSSLLSNNEHLVIQGAGHRAPWDQPKRFSAAVQDFLKRIPTP